MSGRNLGYTSASGGSSDPAGTAAADVAAHEADTTNVHGITDTTVLETVTGAQTKATAAQAAAIAVSAQRASNLSDLASASTARTNLGLGGAATLAVGTTTGTVAAGDDTRFARYTRIPTDHGLLAWSVDPFLAASFGAPTVAGRLEFVRLRVPVAITVTNVVMMSLAVGATLTSGQCFAALFGSSGALIGQTADQASSWTSAGLKTMALTGGPFSVPAGEVLVGFWYNGTTSPGWARVGNASGAFVNVGLTNPNIRVGSADTGLTTTAPANIGTQSATAPTWWAALS